MDQILWDAVEALVSAINSRVRSQRHSVRVARFAMNLARAAGYEGEELDRIRLGALLHDIGQITYTDALIESQGSQMSASDRKLIRDHPSSGVALVQHWPSLRFAIPYILYHQEWIDGSGYPMGVKGDQIPQEVQIVSIADVYEALRYPRHYRERQGLEHAAALAVVTKMGGQRWDQDLVDLFAGVAEDWE